MKISSSEFKNNERIPAKYTCDGDRFLSPPLQFENIPQNTKSLVLIVEDPDVPKEIREDQLFVHWILYNIPPLSKELPEGTTAGTCALNTRDEPRYTGPCPPGEYFPNEHRYFFRLYALDTTLQFEKEPSRDEVLSATHNHVLETAELIGRYKKVSN